jgi:hypothetical protein
MIPWRDRNPVRGPREVTDLDPPHDLWWIRKVVDGPSRCGHRRKPLRAQCVLRLVASGADVGLWAVVEMIVDA